MTIKEAIGKFAADQLTYRYHRLAALGATKETVKHYRDLAQSFKKGNFQIIITGFTADGSEIHNWMVAPHLTREDTVTANKVVTKTEAAMGWDIYYEPFPILKITTQDEMVYYFDGKDRLTTRRWEIKDIHVDTCFDEIEL